MKKVLKQTLSVFLAVVMTFTITLPAFARESEEPQANTQTAVNYESTNAIGSLILDNVEQETSEENADYLIQSVIIENKTATVELKTLDACTVAVAIYEYNGGKMVASGKTDIDANESVKENTVSVTIDTDEMPEYFYVKAFLVDANNAPLCKSYESMEYTKEFEEFMAKTTDDFDTDKVINLDESEDNNFLVVSDDATVIELEEETNIVAKDDYENGIYVIENADEQIKNLKKGDVFYYQYGEDKNDYIITKVENIVVNGDTVTIVAQQEVEMTDYFQYVKIDTESSSTTFDGTEMDSDVVHETVEEMPRTRTNISGEYSVSDKWTAKKDFGGGVSLQFSIKAKMSLGVKLYIDFDLFGEKYAYLEIILSCSSDIEFSLTGKVQLPPISLGTVGIDAGFAEDLGIVAAVKLNFIVEGKVAINIKIQMLDAAIGFSFDTRTGFVNKSRAAQMEFESEVEETITIFVGFALTPEIKVTKHAQIKWESRVGTELIATIPIISQEHNCSLCVKIDLNFIASSEIKVHFFDWITRTVTLGKLTVDIGDFYWSKTIGFGAGKCPNDSSASGGVDSGSGDSGSDIEVIRPVTASGTCGTNLTWTLYDDGELVIDGTGAMTDYTSSGYAPWYSYRSSITNVKIGTQVTTIGNYVFYECENISCITIPNSITIIGKCAFSFCESLTRVTIPDSVITIGGSAFWACDKLECVKIGNSVKTIGDLAFRVCDSLKSVTIPDSVITIGDGAFYCCGSLTDVKIGNSVTTIGDEAFYICVSLKSITIPDSVTTIGNQAFRDCVRLESVTIPDSVTTIGNQAFCDCASLVSITVNENNENYSNDKYGVLFNKDKTELIQYPNGNNRTEYTIPDSVTIICRSAFAECFSLENIIIPDSVESIGDFSFVVCNSLKSIIIPDSVTTIGDDAFYSCNSLTSVTIGDSVTTIGDAAFYSCNSLTSVTIGDSVTAIGDRTFMYCTGLTTVYYTGTEEQWNEISIGSNNTPLTTANIIHSDTVSTASVMSLEPDNKLSAYSLNNMQSESITDAIIGFDYVMIAVKDENAEDLLAPSNLLYIDQKTAESEELTFEYVIDESVTDYDVLVFGQKLAHYHLYNGVVTAPTCTEQGFTIYTCSCGDSYVDDYVDETGHTDEVIPGYGATCTETGLTDGVKCSVCGEVTSEQEIIPVVAHNDGDSDGYCDECGEDLTVNCSHFCHSDGFIGFFWKIINFLQKLFGVQSARYCECGVDHWSK